LGRMFAIAAPGRMLSAVVFTRSLDSLRIDFQPLGYGSTARPLLSSRQEKASCARRFAPRRVCL
jgi:hypothetical protein